MPVTTHDIPDVLRNKENLVAELRTELAAANKLIEDSRSQEPCAWIFHDPSGSLRATKIGPPINPEVDENFYHPVYAAPVIGGKE
jgi:hypothetical protein